MEYQLDFFTGSRVKIRCPTHPKDYVTHVCNNPKCLNRCFFYCSSCTREEIARDHSPHLTALESSIIRIAEEIDKLTLSNQNAYVEMFQSNSEYTNLIKWQDDYKEHIKRVEDHLVVQKVQIAEDIANLMAYFSDICQRTKNELMSRIDNFFLRYRSNFEQLRKAVDEGFALSRSFKYYSNPNNLATKLQTEVPGNLNNYLQSLKEAILKASDIAEGKSETLRNIRKIAKGLNFMADNLPLYRNQESLDNLQAMLDGTIGNFFNNNLELREDLSETKISSPRSWHEEVGKEANLSNKKTFIPDNLKPQSPKDTLRDPKGIVTASRSKYKAEKIFESRVDLKRMSPIPNQSEIPVDRYLQHSFSNDFRNLLLHSQSQQFFTDLTFKHSQRIQIGFPVSCLNPVSSESVILANARDHSLYFYDIKSKKYGGAQSGHTDLITSLTIVQTFEKFMQGTFVTRSDNSKEDQFKSIQAPLGSQSILISTSLDKNVIIWILQGSSLKFYQKLVGFLSPVKTVLDLQDSTTIITGDGVGEIIVWDYHKSKILFVFRGQHSTEISAATMLKNRETFVFCSRDGVVSLWRLKYNSKSSHTPENCNCEKIIFEITGGIIKCLAPYYENQDILALVCGDGFLRLFDLSKKLTVYEKAICFDGEDDSSVELLHISEKIENSQTFVIISLTKEISGFGTLVGGENGNILKTNYYEPSSEFPIVERVRKRGAFINLNKSYPSLLVAGENPGAIDVYDIFFEKR